MARLTMVEKSDRRELAIGLAAALLFGLGAPCAKLLLAGVGATALAGLLYLGAGLGLSLFLIAGGSDAQVESGLQWRDGPLLAAVVVLGGIAGPVLMMMGLTHLSGVAGSLLLNLETPFTIMLALTLFGEHLSRTEAIGTVLIVGAAALLGGPGRNQHADVIGVLELAGACAAWAFDNNFTQRLSIRDPVAVAQIKTLAAGIVVTGLVLATGEKFPSPREVAAAMVLGLLSYGLSLVLYIRALRTLGAARQASLFATAPFAGALLAVPLLDERPSLADLAAGLLMAAGLAAMMRKRHAHQHRHQEIEHEHAHVHDEHHLHVHPDGYADLGRAHSHWHRHEALLHSHVHFADAHHRHEH